MSDPPMGGAEAAPPQEPGERPHGPELLPHPLVGGAFTSPVTPGTGWPGDPADARTPVARTAAQVEALAPAAHDLPTLDARVSVCRACPRLVAWREEVAHAKRAAWRDEPYWGRPAPSFGDERPQLLVIGLAPAAHGANRTGRMFTGDRSGDWIYAALHRAGYATLGTSRDAGDGLRLNGVRIVATAHCAPPQNTLTTTERDTCGGWLDRELTLVQPGLRSVLALGAVGWGALLAAGRRLGWTIPRPKPRFGHGAVAHLGLPDGREVRLVGCYHVSQQNTFTGKLTQEMLDAAIALAGEPERP